MGVMAQVLAAALALFLGGAMGAFVALARLRPHRTFYSVAGLGAAAGFVGAIQLDGGGDGTVPAIAYIVGGLIGLFATARTEGSDKAGAAMSPSAADVPDTGQVR